MNKKKIVVISDSFKGTLSSLDICQLYEQELKDKYLLTCLPIADGGEGSLDAISKILDGHFVNIIVNDLYFNKIKTHYYVTADSAYIECASCVGLCLAKKDNNPGLVTTYGLGEQIKDAVNRGIKNIYVFLGGSASNDGGAGLACALGTKFFIDKNEEFIPTGLTLKDIKHIDNSKTKELVKNTNIVILSDVKSPFYGPDGAAYKFAVQKGASLEEVSELDNGLKHLSSVVKNDLGIDVSNMPGCGAAGGLGGGLVAFANGKIVSGIDTMLDLIGFDTTISDADIVISGEGKIDRQTLDGKVIDGVAKRCLKQNKQLILVVGISELSLDEIKKIYPCVTHLYETNDKHLPFEDIKDSAKEDYIKQIKNLN